MKKYIGTIIILGILLVVLVIAGFAFRGWWLTDWPKLKKRLEKERKSKKGNAKKGKKKEKKKKTLDDYVEKIEVPKGKRIPLFTGEDKWEIEVYRKSNDNGEEIRLTTFKINLLNFIYGDEKGCKIRHISEADNKIIVTAGKKDGFIHGTLRFVQDYGLIFETRKII